MNFFLASNLDFFPNLSLPPCSHIPHFVTTLHIAMEIETLDYTSVGDFVHRNALNCYFANRNNEPKTWGFPIARTSSSPIWDVALTRVKEYLRFKQATSRLMQGCSSSIAEDLIMSRLRFIVLDAEELQHADDQTIREYSQKWRESFIETVPGCVNTNVCLTLEETSLESIANAPVVDVTLTDRRPTQLEEFAVYLRAIDVDYEEVDDEWDEHGPAYRGWTRTTATSLTDLYDDLQSREFAIIAPRIEFHGQIPIYEGQIGGQRIDPPGGTAGRLRVQGDDLPDDIWEQVRQIERREREENDQAEGSTDSATTGVKHLTLAPKVADT